MDCEFAMHLTLSRTNCRKQKINKQTCNLTFVVSEVSHLKRNFITPAFSLKILNNAKLALLAGGRAKGCHAKFDLIVPALMFERKLSFELSNGIFQCCLFNHVKLKALRAN